MTFKSDAQRKAVMAKLSANNKKILVLKKDSIIKNHFNMILKLHLGKKQKDYYNWILHHGESFGHLESIKDSEIVKLIERYRQGTKMKQCYYNSQLAALDSPFDYYEGWYVTDKIPIPLEHGFNVYKGKVLDFTAHHNKIEVDEYLGVKIPKDFIRSNMVKTGMAEQLLAKYYFEKIDKEKKEDGSI